MRHSHQLCQGSCIFFSLAALLWFCLFPCATPLFFTNNRIEITKYHHWQFLILSVVFHVFFLLASRTEGILRAVFPLSGFQLRHKLKTVQNGWWMSEWPPVHGSTWTCSLASGSHTPIQLPPPKDRTGRRFLPLLFCTILMRKSHRFPLRTWAR